MTLPSRPGLSIRDLHPLLFVLSPIVTLYSLNPGEVMPIDLIRPLVFLLGTTVFVWLALFFALRRDAARASLFVTAFLIVFFFYQQCEAVFGRIPLITMYGTAMVSKNPLPISFSPQVQMIGSLTLWGAVVLLVALLCWRTKRDLSTIAWLVGAAFVGPSLLRVGNTIAIHQRVISQAQAKNTEAKKRETNSPQAGIKDSPDLYVIVMDAYARQDILRSMYNTDNEPFLGQLEKRGFVVARQSRANYIQTPLAVGSALNLDYLTPEPSGGTLGQMQPVIDHNRIAALLKERGYHFVSIPTGFDLTATPSADLIFDPNRNTTIWSVAFPSEFENLLLEKTPFAVVSPSDMAGFEEHRRHIRGAFDHLGETAEQSYPKFVFAHILAPHPPFVFDAQGKAYQPVGQGLAGIGDASNYHGSREIYHREYAAQLQYINRRILQSIDDIQKKSHRPYVIVLMGDHGARSMTSWNSLAKTDVHEAFANLFAVYVPPTEAKQRTALEQRLSEVITPINGLRFVMTNSFGLSYPNLLDRSYYSTQARPLIFDDVTDTLNKVYATEKNPVAQPNHLPTVTR